MRKDNSGVQSYAKHTRNAMGGTGRRHVNKRVRKNAKAELTATDGQTTGKKPKPPCPFGLRWKYVGICTNYIRWYETERGRDQAYAKLMKPTCHPYLKVLEVQKLTKSP